MLHFQFGVGACNSVQLTDGTVLVEDCGSQDWWRLSPDNTGNYINGTWSQIASLPAGYSPLYDASAVVPEGRVIVEGGEYNFFNPAWTTLGAIYDPKSNTWYCQPDQCVVSTSPAVLIYGTRVLQG